MFSKKKKYHAFKINWDDVNATDDVKYILAILMNNHPHYDVLLTDGEKIPENVQHIFKYVGSIKY